jgi:hypothetical protein
VHHNFSVWGMFGEVDIAISWLHTRADGIFHTRSQTVVFSYLSTHVIRESNFSEMQCHTIGLWAIITVRLLWVEVKAT